MSQKQMEKKQEDALRILEALSGVDEDLLERSERKQGKAVVYRFVQRHGKALAACLCLCVLGTAFWGMRYLSETPFAGTAQSSDSADKVSITGIAGNTESAMENPAEGAAPEAAMVEDAGTYGAIEDSQEATEPEWIDIQPRMSAEATDEELTGGIRVTDSIDDYKQMTEMGTEIPEQESAKAEEYEEITWEEAEGLEGLGTYVPDRLPDGYKPVYARCRNAGDGKDRLTLLCSSGEKNLWLNITETDWNAGDMFIGLETPVLSAKEDWKSKLPKPDGEGGIQFGLIFEDGVLVEYQGYLKEEEILELFYSMK